MNNPDNVMNEKELVMILCVAKACVHHPKGFGIIGGMPLQQYFNKYTNLLTAAIDIQIIRKGLRNAIDD